MFRTNLLLAIACWACLGIDPVGAVDAPRLRQLIRGAQVVGVGRITAVEDLDFGRLRVYELLIEKELKPGTTEETRKIRVVSLTDQPGAAVAAAGGVGVAFVQPLRRNSYLDRKLPETHGLFEFTDGRDGWLEALDPQRLAAIVTPVESIVVQSRHPAKDAAARAQQSRSLVFALLSAPHPLLVDDGIASLSDIAGLASSLSESETAIITSALHAPAIPATSREKLIAEIAAMNLQPLVGALRAVDEPALQQSAWAALRKMGSPMPEDRLHEQLAAAAPQTRLAAARELLERQPEKAIPLVATTVLRDPDKQVRLGAIEALGETHAAQAAPPLENVFVQTDIEERQASARALREIGGDAAADAFHRLAFVGPIGAQRYAVFALMSLGVGREDVRVRDIATRHSDAKITDMLEHGIKLGHSH